MQRKRIKLIHLKAADYVATDDRLEYTYKGRVFSACVGRDGHIVAAAHAAQKPSAVDGERAYYVRPSAFTNDCVSVFWADEATKGSTRSRSDCLTNPNGFERVVHKKSNKTLNELRDEYMQERVVQARKRRHLAPADEVETPDEIVDALDAKVSAAPSSSASSTTARVPTGAAALAAPGIGVDDEDYMFIDYGDEGAAAAAADDEPAAADDVGSSVAQLLADGELTIETLRASGRQSGYKQIAKVLQTKLAKRTRALRTLMQYVEKFQSDNCGEQTEAAREAARMIGAFVDATVAAENGAEGSLAAAAASSSASSSSPNAKAMSSAAAAAVAMAARRTVHAADDLDGLLQKSLAGCYKQT